MEKDSDCLIYGFPIYWHSIPGILKIFIERHMLAKMPFYDNKLKRTFRQKAVSAMEWFNQFKEIHPFVNKGFITVLACNDPFGGKDVTGVKYILKNFFKDMGLMDFKTVLCTDNLFKFRENHFDKIISKSYNIGRNIK